MKGEKAIKRKIEDFFMSNDWKKVKFNKTPAKKKNTVLTKSWSYTGENEFVRRNVQQENFKSASRGNQATISNPSSCNEIINSCEDLNNLSKLPKLAEEESEIYSLINLQGFNRKTVVPVLRTEKVHSQSQQNISAVRSYLGPKIGKTYSTDKESFESGLLSPRPTRLRKKSKSVPSITDNNKNNGSDIVHKCHICLLEFHSDNKWLTHIQSVEHHNAFESFKKNLGIPLSIEEVNDSLTSKDDKIFDTNTKNSVQSTTVPKVTKTKHSDINKSKECVNNIDISEKASRYPQHMEINNVSDILEPVTYFPLNLLKRRVILFGNIKELEHGPFQKSSRTNIQRCDNSYKNTDPIPDLELPLILLPYQVKVTLADGKSKLVSMYAPYFDKSISESTLKDCWSVPWDSSIGVCVDPIKEKLHVSFNSNTKRQHSDMVVNRVIAPVMKETPLDPLSKTFFFTSKGPKRFLNGVESVNKNVQVEQSQEKMSLLNKDHTSNTNQKCLAKDGKISEKSSGNASSVKENKSNGKKPIIRKNSRSKRNISRNSRKPVREAYNLRNSLSKDDITSKIPDNEFSFETFKPIQNISPMFLIEAPNESENNSESDIEIIQEKINTKDPLENIVNLNTTNVEDNNVEIDDILIIPNSNNNNISCTKALRNCKDIFKDRDSSPKIINKINENPNENNITITKTKSLRNCKNLFKHSDLESKNSNTQSTKELEGSEKIKNICNVEGRNELVSLLKEKKSPENENTNDIEFENTISNIVQERKNHEDNPGPFIEASVSILNKKSKHCDVENHSNLVFTQVENLESSTILVGESDCEEGSSCFNKDESHLGSFNKENETILETESEDKSHFGNKINENETILASESEDESHTGSKNNENETVLETDNEDESHIKSKNNEDESIINSQNNKDENIFNKISILDTQDIEKNIIDGQNNEDESILENQNCENEIILKCKNNKENILDNENNKEKSVFDNQNNEDKIILNSQNSKVNIFDNQNKEHNFDSQNSEETIIFDGRNDRDECIFDSQSGKDGSDLKNKKIEDISPIESNSYYDKISEEEDIKYIESNDSEDKSYLEDEEMKSSENEEEDIKYIESNDSEDKSYLEDEEIKNLEDEEMKSSENEDESDMELETSSNDYLKLLIEGIAFEENQDRNELRQHEDKQSFSEDDKQANNMCVDSNASVPDLSKIIDNNLVSVTTHVATPSSLKNVIRKLDFEEPNNIVNNKENFSMLFNVDIHLSRQSNTHNNLPTASDHHSQMTAADPHLSMTANFHSPVVPVKSSTSNIEKKYHRRLETGSDQLDDHDYSKLLDGLL